MQSQLCFVASKVSDKRRTVQKMRRELAVLKVMQTLNTVVEAQVSMTGFLLSIQYKSCDENAEMRYLFDHYSISTSMIENLSFKTYTPSCFPDFRCHCSKNGLIWKRITLIPSQAQPTHCSIPWLHFQSLGIYGLDFSYAHSPLQISSILLLSYI